MTTHTLMITEISVDPNLQSRVAIHQNVIKDYAETIQASDTLPPLTVFHDGLCYFLADGFHRLQAYKSLGRDRVNVQLVDGGRREAFLFALSANAEHGLRRSHADKRRAVRMALEDPELGQCSSRDIAKHCKVSHSFVNATRESLKPKPYIKASVAQTNWPKPEPRVETFPHDLSDEDIFHESYTAQDEASDTLTALAEENERLSDRLAIAALDATEEEKSQATEIINALRSEVKQLTIERNVLRDSRNSYQNENAELKSQCNKYQAVIKKLNQQKEALESKCLSEEKSGGTPSTNLELEPHPTGTPVF